MIRDLTTSVKTPFIEVEHLCVWSVQPEFSSSTQRGSSNGHFSWETLPSKEIDIPEETCISIGWVARPLVYKSCWSRQGEGANLIVTKKHKHALTYYMLQNTRDCPWMSDTEMLVKPITQTQVEMQTKDTIAPLTFSPHAMTSMLRKQWPSYNKLWQCLQLKPFLLQVLTIV